VAGNPPRGAGRVRVWHADPDAPSSRRGARVVHLARSRVRGLDGRDLHELRAGLQPRLAVPDIGSPSASSDLLVVSNNVGQAIAPAQAVTRLGAFLPGDFPTLHAAEAAGLLTIYDSFGRAITASTIETYYGAGAPFCGIEACAAPAGLLITVPEPLALPAGAALALVACALGRARSRWRSARRILVAWTDASASRLSCARRSRPRLSPSSTRATLTVATRARPAERVTFACG